LFASLLAIAWTSASICFTEFLFQLRMKRMSQTPIVQLTC
jgi:hypothetical protein